MSSVINVSGIFHAVIRLLNTDTSITFGSVLIYVFFLKKTNLDSACHLWNKF